MPKPVSEWPLLLCGPMLRRVEPGAVSVFVALKHPRTVKLSVFAAGAAPVAEQEQASVEIGRYLHVCCVTLRLPAPTPLRPGVIYRYDLTFTATATRDSLDTGPATTTLTTLGLLDGVYPLGYERNALPSFALPPADLNHFKLVHGSCRKPHGESYDALPVLDSIIRGTRANPNGRPHLLLLTGDQIYADDVADPLLAELTRAAELLLGPPAERVFGLAYEPDELAPGRRAKYLKPPFTSGELTSHLLTLGEYCAMYLYVWSDALWPAQLPTFDQLPADEQARYDPKHKAAYDKQVESIRFFLLGVGSVRRALANVATYMIFDDHDVTDDWFQTRKVMRDTLVSSVATGVVVSALGAYAMFQAWGNTPEQFEPGQVGRILLETLGLWRGRNNASFVQLASAVLPGSAGVGLRWDYELVGPNFQLIVLDTRTQRSYPSPDDRAAPDLLAPDGIARQLSARKPQPPKRVTLVVSAAPVFGHWIHEEIQRGMASIGQEGPGDLETWLVPSRRSAFENLLQALTGFERVVLLSGDVHYSFAAVVQYWDHRQTPERRATFLQLNSSAMKNEISLTRAISRWTPGDAAFLGWTAPGWHVISRGRGVYVGGTPAVKEVPMGEALVTEPNWRYRVQFIVDQRSADSRTVPPLSRRPAGAGWMERAAWDAAYQRYAAENDQHRGVVGVNNLATVSFDSGLGADDQPLLIVHQRLWFLLPGTPDRPRPYTSHSVGLDVLPATASKPTALSVGPSLPPLPEWADLISFRPPRAVQEAVRARSGIFAWDFHRLESAVGDISLDYYPVRVTVLPSLAGSRLAPAQLLSIVRKALNSVINTAISEFLPYDEAVDGPVWLSESPLNAVLHIGIKLEGIEPEAGSVACTSFRPDRWIFSTLWTPRDLRHPVSGNRAFGFVANEDGTHTFYTRGADRTTGPDDWALSHVIFSGADKLWTSFQDGLVAYVKAKGGEAHKEPKHAERYNWPEAARRYWSPAEDWLR